MPNYASIMLDAKCRHNIRTPSNSQNPQIKNNRPTEINVLHGCSVWWGGDRTTLSVLGWGLCFELFGRPGDLPVADTRDLVDG